MIEQARLSLEGLDGAVTRVAGREAMNELSRFTVELLDKVPVNDRAKDFLMHYIAQNDYKPCENWDGVIPMTSK